MNNRFKYRVYNKRTEEMLDVRLISYFSTGNICRVEAQNAVGDIKIFDDYKTSIEDIELLQCIGLKDKNGKLIYEGDILKLAEFGKPVEVKHRALGFVLRREPSNTVGYDNDKYIPEDCEVIGNIYENVNLLESEE